jgi:hypothetical protein
MGRIGQAIKGSSRDQRNTGIRGVGGSALVLLLIGVTVIASRHATTAQRSAFAGYVWQGRVKSVSGSWGVPRVLGSSPDVLAGTWIGAQASPVEDPFIQVGTNEGRLPGKTRRAPVYFAFWSDTAKHFHPVSLFPVAPGDAVSAGLTLGPKGWIVTIVDTTSGERARVTTTQETDAVFHQADWTEEDVTDQKTGKVFRYPRLASITFRRVTVNSIPPSPFSLGIQSMSEPTASITPSDFDHDSFTLGP